MSEIDETVPEYQVWKSLTQPQTHNFPMSIDRLITSSFGYSEEPNHLNQGVSLSRTSHQVGPGVPKETKCRVSD
jgi:hypothetical protein